MLIRHVSELVQSPETAWGAGRHVFCTTHLVPDRQSLLDNEAAPESGRGKEELRARCRDLAA